MSALASSTETTLRGHAALFNSISDDLGGFREVLERGAFRRVLAKNPDVRLLLNHDPNYVMARTTAGYDTTARRPAGGSPASPSMTSTRSQPR